MSQEFLDTAPAVRGTVRRPIEVTETIVFPADEATLVRQLAAFEAEAWREVFERYFTSIFRLVYVRTKQSSVSEDIAAQTFAEAAANIRSYRYRGVPFRAWLYRIARNLTADYLKADLRRPRVPLEETWLDESSPATDAETRADLLVAFDDLTDDQKTVIQLRFVDGCSLAEAAALMGKSTGAVKQLQHRALTTLQRRMSVDEKAAG
ncbi:MAG TPA: RNA polymerase sigma factor [Dehalococcoidia bacterium]|nr:RNA polymerase sigma factor [Dehalococcoidia bacterium]